MRCTTVVEINRAQTVVAAQLASPGKSQNWMEDLKSYEPVSGEPGTPGSVARLTFRNNDRTMVFIAKVVSADLPSEMRSTLDSPMVHIGVTARLEAVSDTTTRYTFQQDFQFKGAINKLLGFLARGSLKRQQRRHVYGFKRFVEGA